MSRKKVEMRADRNGRPGRSSYVSFAGGSQALAYVGAVKILATFAVAGASDRKGVGEWVRGKGGQVARWQLNARALSSQLNTSLYPRPSDTSTRNGRGLDLARG